MSIAVYAGTFDPITAGHVSVIRQAARLFHHVRVVVAINPDKDTLFDCTERVQMIEDVLAPIPNVSVDQTSGLVVEYAGEIGACFLVRGIRGATDATFETELAQLNRQLAPEIATILLPAEAALSRVSSTELKLRAQRNQDISSFCDPRVQLRIKEKFGATQ